MFSYNFSFVYVFLLIAHLVADYYLQTDRSSSKKKTGIKTLIYHCLIYLVIAMIPVIFFLDYWYLIIAAITVGAHFIIDLLKFYLEKIEQINKKFLYLADQALHILSTYLIVSNLSSKLVDISLPFDHKSLEIFI